LRLLAICLFLGVAALAGIGSLSSAILGGLADRGQLLLGGDVQFELAQRTAAPEERQAIDRLGRVSEVVRMRAMAALPDNSRAVLAELKGVDQAYPLYGALRLEKGALAARPSGLEAAIAPGLADKLGLRVGSPVRVGEAQFRVMGIIAEEPDRAGSGFTFGRDQIGAAGQFVFRKLSGETAPRRIARGCRKINHQSLSGRRLGSA
jgi:putative ABC transport system permease protein